MLVARGQSGRRLLLVTGCAALVSTLLLVAVALLELPREPAEDLFPLVADPGLRPGLVLALLLLTAPTLLLLWQIIRLGTAARQRRLAVLRLVGATPSQIRLLGAAELGLPALVGAALGYGLYRVLRLLLGGEAWGPASPTAADAIRTGLPGLIPSTVGPDVGQVGAVALVVTAVTALIGWRTSTTTAQPFEVSRRRVVRRPRPWPLVLVGLALVLSVPAATQVEGLWLLGSVAAAAGGLLLSGPWLAEHQGRRASARAESASLLLAGSRLAADPYGAGRAAAPVAVIGLVVAGAAYTVVALVVGGQGFDLFFVGALLLVAVAVLLALLLVTLALMAHGVETLGENRRSTASLAATGFPTPELTASLTTEARLIARPAATLGLVTGLLGVLLLVLLQGPAAGYVAGLVPAAALAHVLLRLLIALATRIAGRLLQPWLRSATATEALRTE